jgi:hypothetical protein
MVGIRASGGAMSRVGPEEAAVWSGDGHDPTNLFRLNQNVIWQYAS